MTEGRTSYAAHAPAGPRTSSKNEPNRRPGERMGVACFMLSLMVSVASTAGAGAGVAAAAANDNLNDNAAVTRAAIIMAMLAPRLVRQVNVQASHSWVCVLVL